MAAGIVTDAAGIGTQELQMNLKRKFISNLSYAFIAQMVAMIISVATNLILPKFMGVESYSYWQLFIFYSQYIPCLHLGLNDGVYLRYGGTPYEQLDKARIKTQLLLGLVYQTIFCILLCAASIIMVTDHDRRWSVYLVCVYFLFYSIQTYIGFVFQAANETAWYSISVILCRVFFMITILLNVLLRQRVCWPYIVGYIFSQMVGCVYVSIRGTDLVRAPLVPLRDGIQEVMESVRAGSKLMLANTASMFVLGSGRQIIDLYWGLTTFGKISFSITLTNFVLSFIQQVGMVLFPMLRQLKENELKRIYELCRTGMFFILPIVFIGYYPVKVILGLWLPDYADSLRYLALMLPVCFCDTKMQMLCNTYLKVMRKERLLLEFNLIAVCSSIVIGLIGAYVFHELNIVVLGMVFSVALRSAIAEIYLARRMQISLMRFYLQEILCVCAFMAASWFLGSVQGFLIVICCYAWILVFNYRYLAEFVSYLLGTIRKRPR